ncbi:alanine racemase [Porcincola intestinalis]|uniref:alanine racemase n=1 Tax=Porcincola intestinalis TaxID=2606632 RepID=UPI002A91C6D7|nr:alanine racemase [Porcincola intestinalis]MDY5578770.1 alanine racemase [Porcincola intestinalis]
MIPNMDMETERGAYPRVEAEIDLGAIRDNFAAMRGRLRDDTKMIAVVKTDAYGHGAVRIAEMMEPEAYIWGFAVATTEEAVELRRTGIRKPILCLGFVFPQDYDLLVRLQIRPATFKLSMARQLSEAASRAGMILPVHLAVDTGMGRIGFQVCEEDADEAAEIAKLSNLKVEGLFTHFARADERDKDYTQEQFRKYCRFEQMLEERGVSIPLRHAANSASIMELPGTHLDAVRAGITIYGIYPSDEVDRNLMPMKPAMSLISHICYIKKVPAGTSISYGGTFVTERESRIATIPVGYGDGYPRSLSNKGSVLIRGRRAPIVGRVCMDQFMVDVTEIEAEEFDRVTLLGQDGKDAVTADELGRLSGRFPYELVCDISKRVPRVYVDA